MNQNTSNVEGVPAVAVQRMVWRFARIAIITLLALTFFVWVVPYMVWSTCAMVWDERRS